jgi:hypothetical protein
VTVLSPRVENDDLWIGVQVMMLARLL